MKRDKPPFRADHVGSLLRPDALLADREKWKKGELSDAELRASEDEHIKHAVKLQEDAGMQSVTDGEYRRETFHADFLSHIEGIESKFEFEKVVKIGEGAKAGEQKQTPYVPLIVDKMRRPKGGIEIENFKYLKSLTKRTPKVTVPSPTMTHFRGGRDAIDKKAYPEMEDFFDDLAKLYREELADLGAAGCTYVQFDDTNLAYLCDEQMRENVRKLGEDPEKLPESYAGLINAAIKDRPKDMAVCVHMCRGNAQSQWFASGGYEPIAEKVFSLTDVDGFFLEYDDERSGGFEPLKYVPKGKVVVLGLVTSKFPELEPKDELKARIDEASKYLDIDQLCLSPQCGFSSNAIGNKLTEADEIKKLELIVETADEVWG